MGYTLAKRYRENGQPTRIFYPDKSTVAEYQDKLQELKVLTRITSHRDWFMKEAIQFQLHPDTSIRSGQQSISELWNSNKNN